MVLLNFKRIYVVICEETLKIEYDTLNIYGKDPTSMSKDREFVEHYSKVYPSLFILRLV